MHEHVDSSSVSIFSVSNNKGRSQRHEVHAASSCIRMQMMPLL
jgi:hypothetical protein